MVLKIDFSRSINPAFLISTPSLPERMQKVMRAGLPLFNAHETSRSILSCTLLAAHVKDLTQQCADFLLGRSDWAELRPEVEKTATAICHLVLSIWHPFLHLVGSATLELIAQIRQLNQGASLLKSVPPIFLQLLYLVSLMRETPTWQAEIQKAQDALSIDLETPGLSKEEREALTQAAVTAPVLFLLDQLVKGFRILPLMFRNLGDIRRNSRLVSFLTLSGRAWQARQDFLELSKMAIETFNSSKKLESILIPAFMTSYLVSLVKFDLLQECLSFSTSTLPIFTTISGLLGSIANLLHIWEERGQRNYRIGIPGNGPITLNDVIGCKEAKETLLRLLDQIKNRDNYTRIGPLTKPKGILFYGPPGTGKSMLARAFATEVGAAYFIEQVGSSFVQTYVGQGALNVRALFKKATLLATAHPEHQIVVFIDEINGIAGKRIASPLGGERETNTTTEQFLTNMDTLPSNVVVIGATNTKQGELDEAFTRAGRFDNHITFELPTKKDRVDILCVLSAKYTIQGSLNPAFWDEIAQETDQWNYPDFYNLMREAAAEAGFKKLPAITKEILNASLEKLKKQKEASSSAPPDNMYS